MNKKIKTSFLIVLVIILAFILFPCDIVYAKAPTPKPKATATPMPKATGIPNPQPTPVPSSPGSGYNSSSPNINITVIVPTPVPATPTPTPIPKLQSFNDSMLEGFKDKGPIDINILNKNEVDKWFSISVRIGGVFVVLAIVFAVAAMFYSGDFMTSAKIKIIIRDFFFSMFMLATMDWWLSWAITGSNLFYTLWDTGPGFTIAGIVGGAGIGVAAAILNPSILVWIAVALVLAFIYQILMSSMTYLLSVAVILLPLFQALFPIKVFKKVYMSILALIFTILAIYPIQNLFILLAKSTLLNNTLSMDSLAGLLGLLIIVVLIIPGIAIGAFMKLFQLINQ